MINEFGFLQDIKKGEIPDGIPPFPELLLCSNHPHAMAQHVLNSLMPFDTLYRRLLILHHLPDHSEV